MEWKNLDVIVLTYNRANYLKIMLESLCNQTATGFNIKVLNNASTDNTVEVVNSFIQKYPNRNISIITNEKNLGNPGNFKRSQEIAQNEYTAIFHDDDAIHPEYINTAMQLFKKHPEASICTCNYAPMYNVENCNFEPLYKDYYLYSKDDGIYLHMLVDRPSFAADIYKTSCYKEVKYYPEKYGKLHDIIFMFETNKLGDLIYLQGQALRYRMHPGADSFVFDNGPFPNEVMAVVKRIKELNYNHRVFGNYLLYYFAKMLYEWSFLEKYLDEKQFFEELNSMNVFSRLELFCFKNKITKKLFKFFIRRRRKHYKHIIKKEYGRRF